MTLEKQVALIDSIIRKEPDFTIKDYLELLHELDAIEQKADQPIEKTIITDWGMGQIKKKSHGVFR